MRDCTHPWNNFRTLTVKPEGRSLPGFQRSHSHGFLFLCWPRTGETDFTQILSHLMTGLSCRQGGIQYTSVPFPGVQSLLLLRAAEKNLEPLFLLSQAGKVARRENKIWQKGMSKKWRLPKAGLCYACSYEQLQSHSHALTHLIISWRHSSQQPQDTFSLYCKNHPSCYQIY